MQRLPGEMSAALVLLLLVLFVSGSVDASQYAVPFSAGTTDFSVSIISTSVSVVCTSSVYVTCQAVKIHGSNQTLLGNPKTFGDGFDFVDVQTEMIDPNSLLVCYSTLDKGGKCVQLEVNPHFGLIGEPKDQIAFCSTGEICQGLNLVQTDKPKSFALCYSLNYDKGVCSMIRTDQKRAERLLSLPEKWPTRVSVIHVPHSKQLVLCAVVELSSIDDDDSYDQVLVTSAECRLLDGETFNIIPSQMNLDLGSSVSIVAGTHVGRIGNQDRLTICYHSSASLELYCAAVYLLGTNFIVSSRNIFPAKYDGLMGLRVHSLSNNPTVLDSLTCLAAREYGTQNLICAIVSTNKNGVIQVDDYELVLDNNGLYYQNVPLALGSVQSVGAYLEQSIRVSAQPDSSDPFISDVTILPDFLGILTQGGSKPPSTSSVSSVGCMTMGMHNLDQSRFCIATVNKLQRPEPPRSPFPETSYCNVGLAWECQARGDHCARVGTNCVSKYSCFQRKTLAACNNLIKAGGECQWDAEVKKCTTTFEWNPTTMCQALSGKELCNASDGCIWAAGQCRTQPYCQLPSQAQCNNSPGCVWIRKQCGVASA